MHLTTKQIELIRVISEGNPDGSPVDMDQILERLAYKPTKESLQFSIRALVAHGLIEKLPGEKRRGRSRRLIGITPLGRHFGVVSRSASYVSSVEDDELMRELGAALD